MQSITFIAVIICVVICALVNNGSNKFYNAIKLGALYPPKVKNGEYWRLLTSGFVHINMYHLMANIYSLYNFQWLEQYLGSVKYAIILIFSIIGGNLLTYKIGKKNVVSVGISGGIYGLLAVYVMMLLRVPHISVNDILQMFLPTIAVNFMPNISVTGHLGGFATGMLLAILLGI